HLSFLPSKQPLPSFPLKIQKQLPPKKRILIDAPHIPTLLLPDPQLKLYIIPSLLQPPQPPQKHNQQPPIQSNLQQLNHEIQPPHHYDINPQISPLQKPQHPITLHTTPKSIEEVT
ncbi:(d)CMP kinase, partial [Staphylococcus epidermidis]|uniref:(d)CMP kinase n=1 Tax=Staphylococcus epidermidis TaxID=1282 RepID=UPI00164329AE